MKKIVILLSLILVLWATGTANALVQEYYVEFRDVNEPITLLLLGVGLIWTASAGRRNLKRRVRS